MKKNKFFISTFVICSIVIGLINFSPIHAATQKIGIYLDNQPLSTTSPPFVEKGVTLVPMRLIFEALGAEVAWFDETQTIMAKKGSISITLTINKTTAFVNTDKKNLPLAPQLKNGITYVPLRFISESLGAEVEWNGDKQHVLIRSTNTMDTLDTTDSVNTIDKPQVSPIIPVRTSEAKKELSIQQIGKLENTIVFIYNEQTNGGTSFGSGFVISEDGTIVTNYHVIANAKQLTLSFDSDKKYTDISVLGYDAEKDIAILKIHTKDKFPFCKLGDSSQATLGDSIFVIGNPMGLRNTLSTGIISSLKQKGYIQITAPISPGSSGGALFNAYGEVIGIASSAILEGQNLGFCIPINEVKNVSVTKSFTLAELYKIENKLTAPQNVTAFPLSSSEIAIQWDYNRSVDYYYVYFCFTPNGTFIPFLDDYDNKKKFDWDDDFSMYHFDLASKKTVYYRVTAVKNGTESAFSKTVSSTTLKDDSDSWIEIVTENYFSKYPKKKIGPAFSAFFDDISWEYFHTKDGRDIVEFIGSCTSDNETVEVLLQFSVNRSANSFKTVYMEIDKVSISDSGFSSLLALIFR